MDKRTVFGRHPALLSSLTVATILLSITQVFGTAACGPSSGGYCEARCDCEGCNRQERADCIDDFEDSLKYADADECVTEFDAYFACVEENGQCTSDSYVSDGCASESDAIIACSARASILVETLCEQSARKLQRCGLYGGNNDCTPDAACVAHCVLNATCADIISPTTGGPFATCTSACSGG